MYTYLHQTLPRVDTSYPISKEKIGGCEYGSALRKRTTCMKRKFRRRLTKVSRLQCLGQDKNKKLPLLNV